MYWFGQEKLRSWFEQKKKDLSAPQKNDLTLYLGERFILGTDGVENMMRIGELAKKVGITAQAIRYYERIGLFEDPARNPSGYRIYDDHAVDFLMFVKKAQSLGFNLQEIKTIWNIVSSGKKPCGYVLKQTENRLREVDKRLEELQEFRLLLLNILKQRQLLYTFPEDSCAICPLIEAADKD